MVVQTNSLSMGAMNNKPQSKHQRTNQFLNQFAQYKASTVTMQVNGSSRQLPLTQETPIDILLLNLVGKAGVSRIETEPSGNNTTVTLVSGWGRFIYTCTNLMHDQVQFPLLILNTNY